VLDEIEYHHYPKRNPPIIPMRFKLSLRAQEMALLRTFAWCAQAALSGESIRKMATESADTKIVALLNVTTKRNTQITVLRAAAKRSRKHKRGEYFIGEHV